MNPVALFLLTILILIGTWLILFRNECKRMEYPQYATGCNMITR